MLTLFYSLTVVCIFFVFSVNCVHHYNFESKQLNNKDHCLEKLYRQCNTETDFTREEILTAQLYLQKRFAVTNPSQPACPVSYDKPPCIRKEVKCLSDTELNKLISAWKQLYSNGVIDRFTKLHNDYWGATHKFPEGPRWHFEFIRLLERELQNIDPDVCMPYWNFADDFAYPELSKIWEIFGHSGNLLNNYCILDGPFANITVNFPERHCIKRQWNLFGQLDAWKSPEWFTAVLQMGFDSRLPPYSTGNPSVMPYLQRVIFSALVTHFDTHLSIGGWNGDMSVPWAPNDPIFFLFHITGDLFELMWQLTNDSLLVPKSYDCVACFKYDNSTGTYGLTNLETDKFAYFDKRVLDSFQFGYGDQCHLYDRIIKPINRIVRLNLEFEQTHNDTDNWDCIPDFDHSKNAPKEEFSLSSTDASISDETVITESEATLSTDESLSESTDGLISTDTEFNTNSESYESITDTQTENTITETTTLPELPKLPNRLLFPCSSGQLPATAQRLRDALSDSEFAKYFPTFASNKWTYFHHALNDISDECNPTNILCRRMPSAKRFSDTLEGQRQYHAFGPSVADMDTRSLVDDGTDIYEEFMDVLRDSGYCSPYV